MHFSCRTGTCDARADTRSAYNLRRAYGKYSRVLRNLVNRLAVGHAVFALHHQASTPAHTVHFDVRTTVYYYDEQQRRPAPCTAAPSHALPQPHYNVMPSTEPPACFFPVRPSHVEL